ncbi:MAG TPA: hypothetical protein VFS13_17905 [Steroidobacteraceae bacterium]|nr:hypothetical protein [Steroidobacteraceae bacterium]
MVASGDLEGALEQYLARQNPSIYQGDLGVVYARLGRREEALREIERLERHGREGYSVGYDLALIYTTLGDLDRGCEMLMRAVGDGSVLVNWIRLDPPLDPLRGRKCYSDAEERLFGGS